MNNSQQSMANGHLRRRRATSDLLASLFARGAGAPFAFVANVLLARLLGPLDFGRYVTLLSAALVASGVAAYGLGPVATREVAAQSLTLRPSMVGAVGRWAFRFSSVFAVVVIAITLAWLTSGIYAPTNGWSDRVAMVAIILLATWLVLISGMLGGLSLVPKSQAAGSALKNGFLLFGVVGLFALGRRSVALALWMQAGALALAVGIGFSWVRGGVRGLSGSEEAVCVSRTVHREWRRLASSFFSMTAAVLLINRLDVVIVNGLVGSQQAGYFGAAARLGQLAGVVGLVWIAWLQPRVARIVSAGAHGQLRRLVSYGVIGSLGLTVCIVAVGWIFAGPLMSALGTGFAAAERPLRIILLGYVFWAASIPYYVVLTMGGHEEAAARILWGQLVMTLSSAIPLVLKWGAVGGAMAWAGNAALSAVAVVIVGHAALRSRRFAPGAGRGAPGR